MVDDLRSISMLPLKDIYTSIGTYKHSEMISLVKNLGEKIHIPVNELLDVF